MVTTDIKEFETQFINIFEKEVVPKIKQFNVDKEKEKEKIRKTRKLIYTFFIIIGIIILLLKFIFTKNIDIGLLAGIIAAPIGVDKFYTYLAKKQFESKLKERVMPILMKAFGDFRWVKEEIISLHEIAQSKMFKINGSYSKTDDDCFIGTYKNMRIKISESSIYNPNSESSQGNLPKELKILQDLQHNSTNEYNFEKNEQYNGIYILLEIPKKFKGHTVVTIPQYKKAVPYEEVKLEDVEFSKMFYVGSTDQIEARYLLTTAFMQRFKNIQKIFGGEYITCSFLYGSLLIFVLTQKDLFCIGDLDKDVADLKQFNIMLKELISIFELIEELKVHLNIGL